MCQPIRCDTCGKTTWTGCGRHVEQVRRTVPVEQWCPGHGGSPCKNGLLAQFLTRMRPNRN